MIGAKLLEEWGSDESEKSPHIRLYTADGRYCVVEKREAYVLASAVFFRPSRDQARDLILTAKVSGAKRYPTINKALEDMICSYQGGIQFVDNGLDLMGYINSQREAR